MPDYYYGYYFFICLMPYHYGCLPTPSPFITPRLTERFYARHAIIIADIEPRRCRHYFDAFRHTPC